MSQPSASPASDRSATGARSKPSRPARSSRPSQRGELGRWAIRGAGLGIGLLVVAIVALMAQAAMNVLVLVFVSILLASAIDPLVTAVRDRINVSRGKVVLGVYVALVVIAVLLALLVVPAAVNQLTELSSRLPDLLAESRAFAEDLEPAVAGTTLMRLLDTLEATLVRGGVTNASPDALVELGLTAADVALTIVTLFTLVFFWLISRETMQRFGLALIPMARRRAVREAWNAMEARMGYWVRGQLILMLTIGAATSVAYFLLGLDNALLLGVIAGLTEIIPIVGPAIGAIPALIVAFVEGGPELALVVAGVYIVIQVIEGNVLVPFVMKNAVGLPPFVVVVSLLIGAAVAGFVGALLAVPTAAALAVVGERAQARRESVALETPIFGETGDAGKDDGAADKESASGDAAAADKTKPAPSVAR
jgi:predicted PurR-regulated permease PerM